MGRSDYSGPAFALWMLLSSKVGAASPALYTPFYGTSANGHTAPARGFNTFGLQAGSATLQSGAGWDFNDYHFRQQCSLLTASPGADYICSIDSGWSVGCNGDDNGIFEPDSNVIPNITDLADFMHGKGLKLGLYILPGAFSSDDDKVVEGTNITLGSLFDTSQPSYNCRNAFDYSKSGVQEFHDSVVARFASWGVDFIKLDYMTPGSPQPDESLPTDSSGAATAYHQAIANTGVDMRLDISWKLDRSDPYWETWQKSSDSLRVDQDINNSAEDTFVKWQTVLRTMEFYRQFIVEQIVESRQGKAIMIHPNLDNTYTGNPPSISGLSNTQRYTQATTWLSTGAPLLTGSDLTRLDTLGTELLSNPEALRAADFTSQYPAQPRNPGTGFSSSQQLQAWIAGPANNTAVVVLANYGPDPCLISSNNCTPTYGTAITGIQNISVTLDDLGIGGEGVSWAVRIIWGGGGVNAGRDHTDDGITSSGLQISLGEGESVLYVLTKQ